MGYLLFAQLFCASRINLPAVSWLNPGWRRPKKADHRSACLKLASGELPTSPPSTSLYVVYRFIEYSFFTVCQALWRKLSRTDQYYAKAAILSAYGTCYPLSCIGNSNGRRRLPSLFLPSSPLPLLF